MLYIRSIAHYRALAYSDTGYDSWTEILPHNELIDPVCFGSVIKYDGLDGRYALLSVNCANEKERKNIEAHGMVQLVLWSLGIA